MKICLTIDVDQAEDFVLDYTLQILNDSQVRATIFATNDTSVLQGLDPDQWEIGIHPDLEKDKETALPELLEVFPQAVGFRTHRLTDTYALRTTASEAGLKYDSNLYLPFPVSPFWDLSGLKRIPFVWSDFVVIASRGSFDFPWRLADDVVWVMAIHPIHIFLNSEALARYERAFPIRGHERSMREIRNSGPVPGAEDSLKALLTTYADKIEFVLAREIADGPVAPSVMNFT